MYLHTLGVLVGTETLTGNTICTLQFHAVLEARDKGTCLHHGKVQWFCMQVSFNLTQPPWLGPDPCVEEGTVTFALVVLTQHV